MFGGAPSRTAIIAHSSFTLGGGTHYADTTAYSLENGTTVFAAGTIQWSWGLDDFNAPQLRSSRLNAAAQQITRNVLARLAGDEFPIATYHAPHRAMVASPVQFDARPAVDPDGAIESFHWNFGDGHTGEGNTPTHAYEAVGRYAVTLTVKDERGAAGSSTALIEMLGSSQGTPVENGRLPRP